MKSILIKFLLAAFLFSFFDAKILAQEVNNVDSIAEKTGDLTPPSSLGDTVLNRNKFEADSSMQDYKRDRDFAYMKYLDSLLRQTKDLTVDTFSVTNASSARGKKEVLQNQSVNSTRRINIFSQPIVKIILWVLAILLIGFIIYKLFLGENFFKRNRSYNPEDTQQEEEEIVDPSAYDKLIAQAVSNKNFRLATRYSYLQTLQMLSGKGLLQFSADKTNYQYVSELRGKSYQNDFAAITLNYEYVWYGKFEISEEVYNRLFTEYRSFHQKL